MELDADTKRSLLFAVLALGLGLAVDLWLNQPDWVAFVVVLVVGIVVPRLLARR